MGCYGIGVSRALAAVVEQFGDENGMNWPKEIRPFDIHLLNLNTKNDEQVELADQLYKQLQDDGFDVLYDDRKERPGVKFNDSDLIGIPYRFVIGKGASEGYIEFKHRQTGEQKDVKISELTQFIEQLRENE